MKEISKSEFQALIQTSNIPVLATFSAPWCGHCKTLHPILQEVSKDYTEKAAFVGINLDDCPELADEFNIEFVPTLILFTNGNPSEFLIAPKDETALKEWLKTHGVE